MVKYRIVHKGTICKTENDCVDRTFYYVYKKIGFFWYPLKRIDDEHLGTTYDTILAKYTTFEAAKRRMLKDIELMEIEKKEKKVNEIVAEYEYDEKTEKLVEKCHS